MKSEVLAVSKAKAGVAPGNLTKGHLGLQPAQVGAQAVVQAFAEGQVLVRRPLASPGG